MSEMNTHTLKQFQTQLKKLESELESVQLEMKVKQKEFELKRKVINDLKTRIEQMKIKSDVIISEHALLRYFERVLGYNLEDIKSNLISSKTRDLILMLGNNGEYPNEDSYGNKFKIILKNNVITTIL